MNAKSLFSLPRLWGLLEPFRPDGGWGIRLVMGPFRRPVSYPFGPNPWSEGRLFTLRLPWVILPFVSYAGSKVHGYIGGKTFYVADSDVGKGHSWARPEDAYRVFVTWSARLGVWERS